MQDVTASQASPLPQTPPRRAAHVLADVLKLAGLARPVELGEGVTLSIAPDSGGADAVAVTITARDVAAGVSMSLTQTQAVKSTDPAALAAALGGWLDKVAAGGLKLPQMAALKTRLDAVGPRLPAALAASGARVRRVEARPAPLRAPEGL